jgi:putative SOS response-associated peptidase YedK
MCYHLSLAQNLRYLENRFGAELEQLARYEPSYHTAAFTSPRHPVIADEEPGRISLFEWGLIPRWVLNEEQARDVRKGTFNAKSETIFQKPSFRASVLDRRCLVLADGFFEWQAIGGKKYPYHIRLKSGEAFAIAGIWDRWGAADAQRRTFSVVTTGANPLLARIHNTKKRMPVILGRGDEGRWLEKGLSESQVRSMMQPYDETAMEAHTVSRLITSKGNRNDPALIAPFEYPELLSKNPGPPPGQEKLF